MPRGVFISFQHEDIDQAKGFALLQWNRNIDFNFRGRHLLSPIDSENDAYIRQKIREMMHGTSVTVVLIGGHTKDSEWVKLENENLGRVGYKYPNWKKKTSFNWTDARKYLGLGESK